MQNQKILGIILLLCVYLVFSCSGKQDKNHDHEHQAGDTHTHETSQSHEGENSHAHENESHVQEADDHEHGPGTHTHEEDEELKKVTGTHTHEEDEAHKHETETQAHVEDEGHEHGPGTHTHEADEAASLTLADESVKVKSQPHTHEDGSTHDPELESGDVILVEEEWSKLIGLETTTVIRNAIELVISVPGQIVPNQNQHAIVSPFIESSVNCVFKNVGARVNEGDMLACLSSPDIGILRAEYDKAKAELEIQKQNYERKEKLYKENIISNKAFQAAELVKKLAEVNYNYSLKKLLALGIKENEIDNPPSDHSEAVGSTIHLYAPISGVITFRDASIGQKVNPSSKMFEIINLNNVWLEADIFEKDLTKIKIGQKVKVSVTAYGEEKFSGKIFYIGNTLNKDTKTINILVELNNRNEKLKPGMFANTFIVVGEKQKALVIPKESILEDENLNIVFVKEDAGFHRHVVTTGIISDEFVEIVSGLGAGDIVVTTGNYQLKSKLKMSGIDPHAGHVH
jgi:membrane fusion protein, heavy metal efflux system